MGTRRSPAFSSQQEKYTPGTVKLWDSPAESRFTKGNEDMGLPLERQIALQRGSAHRSLAAESGLGDPGSGRAGSETVAWRPEK